MIKLERTKNTARNFVWGFLNKIVTLFFPFLLRTVIIRVLGKEYLGLNNLFSSILSVLNLAELGVGTAMVYTMYKPIAINDRTMICSLLALYKKVYRYIGLTIATIGICLIPFLPQLVNGNVEGININILYFIFLADTTISYLLFAYKSSLLVAHQRIDVISNIGTTIQLLLNGIQIVVLLVFKNYYIYIIFKPLFTAINNVIVNEITKKMYPDYYPEGVVQKELRDDIFQRVKALAGHKIGSTIIASADSLVISSFLGLELLSIYSNYYYIVFFLISVTSILFNGMLAGIGNSLVTESSEQNYKLFKNVNFFTIWLVMWCSTCLLCLMQPFMVLWMGEDMLLPFDSLVFIVVYYFTWQFRAAGLFFKDAAGMWKEDFYKPYVAAIINIVMNIVLVKTIGLNGVFISTIFCMLFIYYPWETLVLFKNLFHRNTKSYLMDQIIYTIETVTIYFLAFYVCNKVGVTGVVGLSIRAVICLILPNVVFVSVNYRRPEFKFVLEKVKQLLKRGKQ